MSSEIVISDSDQFDQVVNSLPTSKPFALYFTANEDSTGKSWCPDCVRAAIPVREAATKAGVQLVTIKVGDRTTYVYFYDF